jgi:hypothetical protein
VTVDAPRTRESFWRRVLVGILPLLVWSIHFAFTYGVAAAQCTPAGLRPGGPDRMLLGAVTVTVAAAGGCAWLAWRARAVPRRADAGLLDWARLVLAVLALVAVAWAGVPLLLVAGCA